MPLNPLGLWFRGHDKAHKNAAHFFASTSARQNDDAEASFFVEKPRYLSGSRWLYNKGNLKTSGVIRFYDFINSPTAILRGGFLICRMTAKGENVKRIYFLSLTACLLVVRAASAGCPDGYAKFDAGTIYVVVEDSGRCPDGYAKVADTPVITPHIAGECKPSLGDCSIICEISP